MSYKASQLILVVGGTGTQGRKVAQELLVHGYRVRILTRDPASLVAQQLISQGAEISKGDLGDPSSLAPAMQDVTAIFSVQYADPFDPSIEPRNASHMIQAAKDAGIRQVVHTSSAGSNVFPRWEKGPLLARHLESKYNIEELVRQGGFPYWTILHPCWFMENFDEPLSALMAPELKSGHLFGVLNPDTPILLNCGEDVARFARACFERPEQFQAHDINVAGDELSMTQIAEQLSQVLGQTITYDTVTEEEAITRGLLKGTCEWQAWMNETAGYGFKLSDSKAYGVPLKSFKNWLEERPQQAFD